MIEHRLNACLEDAGKRLDLFIMEFVAANQLGLSRTAVQKLIVDGDVLEKKQGALKANYKIKLDDQFIIGVPEIVLTPLKGENIPLDVVYQDDDLAVINKQIGLVVHPAPGNYEHTLVNALLYRFKELSDVNPLRPGIVHRLDKETSGLLVIAKNNFTHLKLAEQFAQHSIKRKYAAIVRGRMEFDENVIEMPIGRHPVNRKNMAVGFGPATKYAKTLYRTIKRGKNASLLELEPFTGRTHQLRVHLSFLGNPILGDKKYGRNNEFVRLALHAKYLGFIHPRTNEFIEFSCALPKEFLEFNYSENKS